MDVSERWIQTAQKRLKKYPNVSYALGDIADLKIADNAYDIVVTHFVLHHIEKSERREKVHILGRKLKPRGHFFIRKPTGAGHGTSAAEIRAVMSSAGLRERESRLTKSLTGKVFDGVFEKVPIDASSGAWDLAIF